MRHLMCAAVAERPATGRNWLTRVLLLASCSASATVRLVDAA
jgi:hypothetical protein